MEHERIEVAIRYRGGPKDWNSGHVFADAYHAETVVAPPTLLAVPYESGFYRLSAVENGTFVYWWEEVSG